MENNKSIVLSSKAIKGGEEGTENAHIYSLADAMQRAAARVRLDEEDPDPYGYLQELEPELLPQGWQAQPDDDRWNKRLKARSRKAAISDLYRQGLPIAEIAQSVGCSEKAVYSDLAAIGNEWRKTYIDNIEVLAARDLARLDYQYSKLMPAIGRGDVKAILAGNDIIKARSQILGYGAGIQVDVTQYMRQIAIANNFDPDRAEEIATSIRISMK